MRHLFLKFLSLSLITTASFSKADASPLQPWDHYYCSGIWQGDGQKIGAICYRYSSPLMVDVIDVYYFGHLWRNRTHFKYFNANLSVDGSFFARRSLQAKEFGDGNNLPKQTVLVGQFIVSTSFSSSQLSGKDFAIFFQAEEIHPTVNPPFQYDNVYGANYHGKIGRKF